MERAALMVFLIYHGACDCSKTVYNDAHNRNRNLKISKELATQKRSAPGHQLTHELCDESKGGFQRGVKRNSGPISRVPGGDRVAVRVGVVEMGRGNDQKGQGRRD